jgi:vacuolar-type H+-ATPase subunit B/Vma2
VTPFSDAVPVITASRTVGQMATTTSSLIIPETPTIDIAGPLGDTGEVVVTGQIRLPQSLSEVGSLPALVMDRDDDEVMESVDGKSDDKDAAKLVSLSALLTITSERQGI